MDRNLKNKYKDVFTERMNTSIFFERKNLERCIDKMDYSLHTKIASPISEIFLRDMKIKKRSKYKDIYEILNEINNEMKSGKDHILYQYYQEKYGDLGLSTNILIPYLDIYDLKKGKPPEIKELIVISHEEDSDRIASSHVNKMPNFKPILLDSIISTTDKKHWKSQRNDYVEAFDPFESLKKIIPISQSRARKCSNLLWEKSIQGRRMVNMNDFFLNETQAQLQLSMFGVSNEFQEETNKKIRDAFAGSGKKGYTREFAFKLIDELNLPNRNVGPLGKVLKDRIPETDTEKYGNSLIYAFAGHDTTGHTLTWLIFELCKNINLQKELQQEVDTFWLKTRRDGDEITFSDFKKLPFMTKCIMETLRLWPAVPNGTFRKLTSDDFIRGIGGNMVKVKKGTYVQIFNWSKHRNPKLWGDDSNIFNPHRIFDEDEVWGNSNFYGFMNPASARFSPFTYPPRDCIGKNFAQLEMRLILLYLLRDYTFVLTDKQLLNAMDDNYLGSNRATMGPVDVYNTININDKGLRPYHLGMYCNVISRHAKL